MPSRAPGASGWGAASLALYLEVESMSSVPYYVRRLVVEGEGVVSALLPELLV
jgi:hypothetical protein